MKVIGWTRWYDPRYPEEDLHEPQSLFEERWQATVEELRKHNYHMDGFYHQEGELGVPVFDDGGWMHLSHRSWGRLMAESYPEETGDDLFAYVVWAWKMENNAPEMVLPKKEDYPDYEFWDQSEK